MARHTVATNNLHSGDHVADIAIVAGSLLGCSLAVAVVYKEADYTATANY